MTIRFAAAQRGDSATIARALTVTAPILAANDNTVGFGRDSVLSAALRHFALHGLSAAEQARESAEEAFFAGDRARYDWWIAICRALDRRMAEAVHARRGSASRT
jgi:hypothetical protein